MRNIINIESFKVYSGAKKGVKIPVLDRPAHTLELPLTIINGSNDGPTVLITAGTHGTEYVGIAVALRVIREIDPSKVSGAVFVAPIINILGYELREKDTFPIEDDYNGKQNMGALYPGDPEGSPHRLTLHHIFSKLVSKSQYLIDLHGGDLYEYLYPCTMIYPTGKKEFDDTLKKMAKASGIEYCISQPLNKNSKGLTAECAKLGIPLLVIEVGSAGIVKEDLIELSYNAVINVLKTIGVLSGRPKTQPEPKYIKGITVVRSTRGGFFHQTVETGSLISKGEKLGEIIGLDGQVIEEIHAPINGLLIQSSCNPSTNSGDGIIRIAEFY